MKYVPPLNGGPDGPYVDSHPETGVEGSILPAAAIEHVQREIVNAITAAGLTPSAETLDQLSSAIVSLADDAIPAATTTVAGRVELATEAEVQAGTDATRAVTPAGAMSTYMPRTGGPFSGTIGSAGLNIDSGYCRIFPYSTSYGDGYFEAYWDGRPGEKALITRARNAGGVDPNFKFGVQGHLQAGSAGIASTLVVGGHATFASGRAYLKGTNSLPPVFYLQRVDGSVAGSFYHDDGTSTIRWRVYDTSNAGIGSIMRYDGTTLTAPAFSGDGSGLTNLNLVAAFPGQFTASGYQRLPSGLITQWGRILVPADNAAKFTFPISFPTAVLNGQVSTSGVVNTGQDCAATIYNLTLSGGTIQNGSASSEYMYWQVIGR